MSNDERNPGSRIADPGLISSFGIRHSSLTPTFDMQMATGESSRSPLPEIIYQVRTILWSRLLVPVLVVHHHDRRAVAGAEALELQEREHARRVGLADLQAEFFAERLGDALRAGQRARQRPAHLQHVLADRRAEEHHV